MHRRRKSRQNDPKEAPAIYVDKDRAISVAGGAEDLKGDILKHRGNLIKSNRSVECEAAELQIILDQAHHEIRRGDPWKAMSYLERAFQTRNDDVECLHLKGQCLVALNRHQEALDTMDLVLLKERTNHSRAFGIKGDALYNLGQFEHALLNYHRGMRHATAKEKINLNQKMNRVEAAVWNALGEPSNRHFLNLEKISQTDMNELLDLKVKQTRFGPNKRSRLQNKTVDKPYKDKKFLSELAKDKAYLGGILQKIGPGCGSSYKSFIQHQANDGIQFLKDRRDFWEQQRPDYTTY
ncbi:outer dynein arm-docking complex subunit 4 isoform X2 [Lepeophtheirus salmonis]|nr:outer dynein arm-docking complex subunit 4-like isoform X2 [Lepeophtheirus salmonis]XP_040572406.1 outer dynein arm-docking complex subunit 4-like isoform X2 [Lepeophtheirus salmonis]